MSRRLFEYQCADGHVSEALTEPETQEILCRTCGDPAHRIISPVRSKLEGITGAFPGAYDKWARVHEEATRLARKRKLDHEGPSA